MLYQLNAGSHSIEKQWSSFNRKHRNETEVLLHTFENEKIHYKTDSTIYFHKKIHGSVNLKMKRSTPRI